LSVFTIRFKKDAEALFLALDKELRRRIGRKIDALMLNPFAAGITKLHGYAHLYLIVMIVCVAHRKDVYRDL
jgi:mRNA-degrading endonuclease RelE of RelBE toxin-antitoxin system